MQSRFGGKANCGGTQKNKSKYCEQGKRHYINIETMGPYQNVFIRGQRLLLSEYEIRWFVSGRVLMSLIVSLGRAEVDC